MRASAISPASPRAAPHSGRLPCTSARPKRQHQRVVADLDDHGVGPPLPSSPSCQTPACLQRVGDLARHVALVVLGEHLARDRTRRRRRDGPGRRCPGPRGTGPAAGRGSAPAPRAPGRSARSRPCRRRPSGRRCPAPPARRAGSAGRPRPCWVAMSDGVTKNATLSESASMTSPVAPPSRTSAVITSSRRCCLRRRIAAHFRRAARRPRRRAIGRATGCRRGRLARPGRSRSAQLLELGRAAARRPPALQQQAEQDHARRSRTPARHRRHSRPSRRSRSTLGRLLDHHIAELVGRVTSRGTSATGRGGAPALAAPTAAGGGILWLWRGVRGYEGVANRRRRGDLMPAGHGEWKHAHDLRGPDRSTVRAGAARGARRRRPISRAELEALLAGEEATEPAALVRAAQGLARRATRSGCGTSSRPTTTARRWSTAAAA